MRRVAVHEVAECLDRGPDRHVDDQPVVAERANRRGVAVLGLQPPPESGRRVGDGVDRFQRVHEPPQFRLGQRDHGKRDVDLCDLPTTHGGGAYIINLVFTYISDACYFALVHLWRERLRDFWSQRLSALATEIVRGKRERRPLDDNTPDIPPDNEPDGQQKDDR
jgi:hypothetical protein